MARAALGVAIAIAVLVACVSPAPSGPATDAARVSPPNAGASPTPTAEPDVVDPAAVDAALRTVVPELALRPYEDRDGLGVFPPLSFANQAGFDRFPRVARVLVFASPAERAAMQSRFGESTISGMSSTLNWDGPVHSEWVPAKNVLVEVVVPGGMFGKVVPWTDPDAFLGAIRSALRTL